MQVDLGALAFDEGGHLLVKRALRGPVAGEAVIVTGTRARSWTSICAPGAARDGHRFEWPADGPDGGTRIVVVNGGAAARPVGGRRARRATDAGRPDRRAPAAHAGAWPRAARWSRPARPSSISISSTRSRCGPTRPPRLYAQAAAAQWDPETAIPWNAPFDACRRGRGRRRADHDVPDRERDRGADRSEPLHRAAAPALPRGDAAARGPGRRRGAAHRGVHPARAAQARPARPVDGRRPGVAQDAGRRARLRHRVVPAVGARRGHVPLAAVVHRAVRAGPGDRGGGAARRAGRGAARRVRPGAPRPASEPRAGAPAAPRRRDPPAARRASAHRRPQRRSVRRAAADGRRLLGARRVCAKATGG